MTHVETNVHNVRRLLHVKGRRNVAATEVSLGSGTPAPGLGPRLPYGKAASLRPQPGSLGPA